MLVTLPRYSPTLSPLLNLQMFIFCSVWPSEADRKTASTNFSEPTFTSSYFLEHLVYLCSWPVHAVYGAYLLVRQSQITGWNPASQFYNSNKQGEHVTDLYDYSFWRGLWTVTFDLCNLHALVKLLAETSTMCLESAVHLHLQWNRIWAPISQRVYVHRDEARVPWPHKLKGKPRALHIGLNFGSVYNSSERPKASICSSRLRKLERICLLDGNTCFLRYKNYRL